LYDDPVKPRSVIARARRATTICHTVTNDAGGDTGPGTVRGFLFSDIRGFTAFAEKFGNAAAAERVARFLDLARAAIAQHEGAEIKTEGDAIHAVFPSASMAVMCGLEIVEAAQDLAAREGDRPLDLGVGVHAGEAIETGEGYIGTAVNIAARLCAAALPREILVSSAVKSMTQTVIPVGFIARGRRRLKGIREPVEVFAITRDRTAYVSRTAPSRVVGGAILVALAVLVGIGIIVGVQGISGPVGKATATPGPAARPVAIGPLAIESYASVSFQPPVIFGVQDTGWSASRDTPMMLGLVRQEAPRGSVQLLRVQEVITIPCGEGEGASTPLGPADLLTALQGLTHLTVSDPVTVRVGGYAGREVMVDVKDEALAACGGLAGVGGVTLFMVGNEIWSAASGERFRLTIVDVHGSAVTIATSADWSQTPSVQELVSMLEYGARIVAGMRF
jgi:class 3 adenylate cyclase